MSHHVAAVLVYVGLSACITYGLYIFYAAVMNIKRVYELGKLTRLGKVLAYPALVMGYALDVVVNVCVMSVVLLELPREMTVTARLKRHKKSAGWRLAVALFFEPVLDPLDPSGDHI